MEACGGTSFQGPIEIGNFVAEVEQLYAITQTLGDRRILSKGLKELDGEAMKLDKANGDSL
jgi:hypothetical protein